MARQNNNGNNRARLDKIYDVFDKHKVDIDKDAIWEVQGTPVVKHKDVERLGAAMGIRYDKPQIIRAEADEAVIIVFGSVGDKMEWSIGEAKITQLIDTGRKNNWNKPIKEPKDGCFGNYIVSGSQAAYPYAMAEKRAKDRVILKLADLHGDAYSSEEADDFKSPARGDSRDDRGDRDDRDDRRDDRQDNRRDDRRDQASNDNRSDGGEQRGGNRIEDQIIKAETDLRNCKEIKQVTDFMNSKDVKALMAEMSKDEVSELRAFATQRLKDLGWSKPAKEAANG
jgi:hypothetical protein